MDCHRKSGAGDGAPPSLRARMPHASQGLLMRHGVWCVPCSAVHRRLAIAPGNTARIGRTERADRQLRPRGQYDLHGLPRERHAAAAREAGRGRAAPRTRGRPRGAPSRPRPAPRRARAAASPRSCSCSGESIEPHFPLYDGVRGDALAETAPYLVRLPTRSRPPGSSGSARTTASARRARRRVRRTLGARGAVGGTRRARSRLHEANVRARRGERGAGRR